ncbi:MAG: SpoIID/LytB domain-containing protein [Cyanobacteriota bacterium]|nr:SpoIID/LytB domain-containing protein [Cyanobacteriota bacterium]
MLTRPLAAAGGHGKNGRLRLPFPLPVAGPALRAHLRPLLGWSGLTLLLMVASPPLMGGARSNAPADGTVMAGPLASGPPVRVLLLQGPVVTIGAAGPAGLRLRDQDQRPLLELEPGRQLRVRRNGASLSLEPVADSRSPGGETDAEAATPRVIPLQELRLDPAEARSLVVLKQRRYRGSLLLRPEGEDVQVINRLPLETYLLGVVGSEMPNSWPLAALRAQAVASRTYALQQLKPRAPYDLQATVVSQVYKGVDSESPTVREAVASTHAQVLTHGERLINAVFHSSSGGRTENSGDLWKRQLPYLVSVADDDAISPVSRWEKSFTPEALTRAFREIGGAVQIQPVEISSTGRVRRAKVIGPGGELLLSGSGLRERLGLRSTLVRFRFEPAGRTDEPTRAGATPTLTTLPPGLAPPPPLPGDEERPAFAESSSPSAVRDLGPAAAAPSASGMTDLPSSPGLHLVVEGRGYGHGVGMSQWGAYALALRGKSHEDILRHYYRGAVLRTW